jgi:hypothetical protein
MVGTFSSSPEGAHTMTADTVSAPPLSLDPSTRSTLLQTIVDCLPQLPNATDAEKSALREAAFFLVAALDPRDPLQAMFAAHLIAAHYASLNAFRHAARPDLLPALRVRYKSVAGTLSRLTINRLRELKRLQGQPMLPAMVRAAVVAPRAQQAPAGVSVATVRQGAPAVRPGTAGATPQPGDEVPAGIAGATMPSTGDPVLDAALAAVAGKLADAGIGLSA